VPIDLISVKMLVDRAPATTSSTAKMNCVLFSLCCVGTLVLLRDYSLDGLYGLGIGGLGVGALHGMSLRKEFFSTDEGYFYVNFEDCSVDFL